MQKVDKIEIFKDEVGRIKQKYGKTITNCYLMPDMISSFILKGRFYYEITDTAAVFYSDEIDYYKAYFYIAEGRSPGIARKEKPVLGEIVYSTAASSASDGLRNAFTENGFVYKDTMLQVKAVPQSFPEPVLPEGFRIVKATKEQIPQIRALWKDTLDIFNTPYLDDEEMSEFIERGVYTCVAGGNDRICAACQNEHCRTTEYYKRIAVAPDMRRKGFGAALKKVCLTEDVQRGIIASISWIETNNVASFGFHTPFGYALTGKAADKYILR